MLKIVREYGFSGEQADRKRSWPEGEWHDEPDELIMIETETLTPCLIKRGPLGSLCGYAGVSKNHKYYRKHYDDPDVQVHGGLTFADTWKDEFDRCSWEGMYEDKIWYFGFDCAHAWDLIPDMMMFGLTKSFGTSTPTTYKNIKFVKKEILSLVKQLNALR